MNRIESLATSADLIDFLTVEYAEKYNQINDRDNHALMQVLSDKLNRHEIVCQN